MTCWFWFNWSRFLVNHLAFLVDSKLQYHYIEIKWVSFADHRLPLLEIVIQRLGFYLGLKTDNFNEWAISNYHGYRKDPVYTRLIFYNPFIFLKQQFHLYPDVCFSMKTRILLDM